MGVPYVPVVGLIGTDLLTRRDDMVVAVDPFDGKTKSVVARAMTPDVAVFHAVAADRHGNVSCGYDCESVVLAEASRHVVVTAERIVDHLPEKDAQGTFIPGIHVDSVVHAPFGAHPGGCTGFYGQDKIHMRDYVIASKDDDSFAEYIRAHVFEVKHHADYIERFVPLDWRQPARAMGG